MKGVLFLICICILFKSNCFLKIDKIFPDRGPAEGNTRVVIFSSRFKSINEKLQKDSMVIKNKE